MENGWQMKFGPTLPLSTSMLGSSTVGATQIPPQEPRNQVKMNLGHSVRPHNSQETMLMSSGIKPAPAVSYMLNFGACKPVLAESGHSFLSVLSGPPSLVQHDFQQETTVKSTSGGYYPANSAFCSTGIMPNRPFLQNNASLNPNGPTPLLDLSPGFPFRPTKSTSNYNIQGRYNDLNALKEVIRISGSRNENGSSTLQTGLSSLPSRRADGEMCHSSNSNSMMKASPQAPSSVKKPSVGSGCPRVFCMSACGDLLLSNTGLLGILCSCHGLHMSVSNFCEHSGLSDVNPGYAVRMDTGECIAQWRKLYLQKFGIRAPDDHKGWDWPEGLLTTCSLLRSNMAVPDRNKVFDLSGLFTSSAESVKCSQPRNNMFPRKPQLSQECGNEISKTEEKGNGCYQQYFLMDHTSGPRRNLHSMTDNPLSFHTPSCSMTSKVSVEGGSRNGYQSGSFHSNVTSTSENLFSLPYQNVQSIGSKTHSNLKDDIVLQRGALPSSIELKLGQPSQQGWGVGSTTLSPMRSNLQKATFQEQHSHELGNSRVTEHIDQHLHFNPTFDLRKTKDQFQLGLLNNTPSTANGASIMEQATDGLYNCSEISLPIPSFNTLAGVTSVHHKEKNKVVNETRHCTWRQQHSQPHVDKSRQMEFSCNGGDGPIWPLGVQESALQKKENNATDTRCGDYSNVGSESRFTLYAQEMENSGFFTKGDKPSHPNSSRVPDEKYNSLEMAGFLPDVYCGSNHIGNIWSLGNILDPGHVNSSLGFRASQTLQASSFGSTPFTVIKGPGHDSPLNKDVHAVDSHRPDESLRVRALRSADESLKEKPIEASMGLNQRPRNHPDQREWIKNCSISDAGAQFSFLDPGPSKGRHEHLFNNGDSVTPNFVLDTGGNKACDLANMTTAEGSNNWDGSRVVMHGMDFNSEVIDKCARGPCAAQPKKQSSLSLGRGENKVNKHNMWQRCCEGSYTCISDRCCCTLPSVHSNRECYLKDTGSMNGLKKQASIAVVEAPKVDGSRPSDNSAPIKKAVLVECNQKMKEKILGELDCLDSRWRDVPPKSNPVSKMRSPNTLEKLLGKDRAAESHSKEAVAKFISSDQVDVLQGNELSNISSGSCARPVTQGSIEVDKFEPCTFDADGPGKGNDHLADRGSVIDVSCSSLDAIDSVKSCQPGDCGKAGSTEEESRAELLNVASHGLADEFKQRLSASKELQILADSGANYGEVSTTLQKNEHGCKPIKRKPITKRKMLGVPKAVLSPSRSPVHTGNSFDNHIDASENVQVLLQSNLNSSNVFDANIKDRSFKRRRSSLSSVKMLSHKRDLNGIYKILANESDDQRPVMSNDETVAIPEKVSVKRTRRVKPAASVMKPVKTAKAGEQVCLYNPDSDGTLKCSVQCCQKPVVASDENVRNQKAKPIACGKYGIICNRELDLEQLKHPKIVSLKQVLKSARRLSKFESEYALASVRNMVNCSDGRKVICGSFPSGNKQISKMLLGKGHFYETSTDDCSALGKFGASGSKRSTSFSSCCPAAQSKPKEIRVRSVYELSMRGKGLLSAEFSLCQTVMCELSSECELEREKSKGIGESETRKYSCVGRRSVEKPSCSYFISELDAKEMCCICGISNRDNSNCLLECAHCFIQIHQACYGISRVSKGDWYCRPCKTGAKHVVCVLCGYGGGAMTRAFGSRGVVKSLLKAWNIRTDSHIMGLGSAETFYVPAKIDSETAKFQSSSSIKPVVHNSITAGLFDRTVRQWVHMVCGLWTPGTRSPNVSTMSAFDVSGVSHPKAHVVCHICKRPGGPCIQCHVETCRSFFHPWCAHQKGLLQNDVECSSNHEVRFYPRCLLHANHQPSTLESDNDTDKIGSETEQEKEPTCARTKVFKGTKLEGGKHSSRQHNGRGKCLVTQVQLDAWFYINRQKLGVKRLPKAPVSDADHDYRKEYALYKQAKGWKQLVVYKSGIHALGLYTSQFIPRGGMVVEYVGEIVGPRVADKRESEYLSGRRLLYQGACYFFRIDKEQIIDATRKGGIARFVNHSCQPNCVAKVITIRSEKKVVFFAERDIYPGEEITYDYHFNHEDEGKKIPCFCKSNNCRRYLN